MTENIYADYAATTPTDLRVVEAMQPYFSDVFGNPSSRHVFGIKAHEAMTVARSKIADFLRVKAEELYFTASGTESNNLAVLGIARAHKNQGTHIVTSSIEHPSIIHACRSLERDGYSVTYVQPDKNGVISANSVADAVTDTTTLVSIHLANSEIGVIQDFKKISKTVKAKNDRTVLHTDACQATSYINLNCTTLGVDALTLNGSKAYGPKGIAVLFVRSGVPIFPVLFGGGQERSLRSGTENVPSIVGLAKAVELISCAREFDEKRIGALRDQLQRKVRNIKSVIINVENALRLPNHLSLTLTATKSTDLVRDFSERGIAVSSGSACSSKSLNDSHVLTSLGISSEEINKTIRISLGRDTTVSDLQRIFEGIQELAQ